MVNEYIVSIYYIMWGFLVFSAISFFISGLDDLFFDVFYWISEGRRVWKYRHAEPLTYEKLIKIPEQRLAVMIPCWHEAGVIEVMLKHNVFAIEYNEYDLFVGVYPNDPATIAAVDGIIETTPHVHCVVGPTPGPTNKASNLNIIFEYIKQYEKENNIQYAMFILHDSEDIIHPLGFKLFNYLVPRYDMVQIPVFPLPVELYHLTHWTYAAEFSEIHTKDIFVRERIGGLVPSAGVGTAFSRRAIEMLTKKQGSPFRGGTLTEDYDTALQIRLGGLSQVFVSQKVLRTEWRKKWYFFGKPVSIITKKNIATQALFPMEYMKAVRQKTRWILGIAFQEWVVQGWRGNPATLYTLLHDRKSLFTHLVDGMFFLLIPFWIVYIILAWQFPDYPTLQDRFDQSPWVWVLVLASTAMMINRVFQRAIALWRVYGFWPALLTPILILYGNIINLHALLRAYRQFLFEPTSKKGATAKWDKTDHHFAAEHLLIPFKQKLGALLVQDNVITKEQLAIALNHQSKSGSQLGSILVELGYINKLQLINGLAKQFKLSLIPSTDVHALPFKKLKNISRFAYGKLLHYQCVPIKLTGNELLIAFHDPSNEVLLKKVVEWIKPYQAKFVLVNEMPENLPA